MKLSPSLISVAYSRSDSKIIMKRSSIDPFNVLQTIPVFTQRAYSNSVRLPFIKHKPSNKCAKRNAAIYCIPKYIKSIKCDAVQHSTSPTDLTGCFPKRNSIAPICLYKMPKKCRFGSPTNSYKNSRIGEQVSSDIRIKRIFGISKVL